MATTDSAFFQFKICTKDYAIKHIAFGKNAGFARRIIGQQMLGIKI
jgi:hypothetical protein